MKTATPNDENNIKEMHKTALIQIDSNEEIYDWDRLYAMANINDQKEKDYLRKKINENIRTLKSPRPSKAGLKTPLSAYSSVTNLSDRLF